MSLAGVFVVSLSGVFTAAQAPSAPRTSEGQTQLATIKQYCAGCHNDRAKIGGVSFDGLTAEEHQPARGRVGESRAQDARTRHAAARRSTA